MSDIRSRKYGVQTTIEFELYEIDNVDLRTDWTPAQVDCEIEKDEGGYTMCVNTASGTTTYKIILTATEMEFARGALKIVDAVTKVFLDKVIYIETYGHASAQYVTDLTDIQVQIDRNADLAASRKGFHTWQGNVFYVAPVNGNDSTGDGSRALPYKTIQAAHDDLVTDSNHDVIILLADAAAGVTTHTVAAITTISKKYTFIRGPGRDFIITRTGAGNTINIEADGVEISGVQIGTAASGSGDGVNITDADFHRIHHCWFLDTRGDGIHILRGSNTQIHENHFEGTGVGGTGQGVHIVGTAGSSNDTVIHNNHFAGTAGDSILIEQGTTNDTEIHHNTFHNSAAWAVNIGASSEDAQVHSNVFGNNASGDINDGGTDSIIRLGSVADVADAVLDEVNTGAAHNVGNSLGRQIRELKEQIGYQDGAIWIDTVNGAAGTTVGEHGVVTNPVNSIGNALTLAVAMGIVRLHIASGSSITLTAAVEGYEMYDSNWTLALGGQSISASSITGAVVSGIASGAVAPKFRDCHFDTVTLPPCHCDFCGFAATVTAAAAGTFFFDSCHSAVAGTGSPVFDFGSGLDASNLNIRHYSGGTHIHNMGAGSGSYNMSLEGFGQLIINANCSGGTVAIRGHFTITDNAGAALTLSNEAMFDHNSIIDSISVGIGAGAITFTYTLTSTVSPNLPIADADVWVTTDAEGINVVASGRTDQNGVVVFYLDAGTVYLWRQKSSWNFDNPDTEVVA